jgi:hypothetical protein
MDRTRIQIDGLWLDVHYVYSGDYGDDSPDYEIRAVYVDGINIETWLSDDMIDRIIRELRESAEANAAARDDRI